MEHAKPSTKGAFTFNSHAHDSGFDNIDYERLRGAVFVGRLAGTDTLWQVRRA